MNKIKIIGEVMETPAFSHSVIGEKFFRFFIKTKRLSGTEDFLPCLIRETYAYDLRTGDRIVVDGEIRTCNLIMDGKRKLSINIFVNSFEMTETEKDENSGIVNGCICKRESVRNTPKGREIIDFILASNRKKKTDYIPCIAWRRNAFGVENMEIGTNVEISGRLQSRTYIKMYEDGSIEEKVALEFSVSNIKEKGNGKNKNSVGTV